ncbi:MAG: GatB/YqeY domain-containing protein [Chloroflexota bacterium]|nr:GatB/YqeY domain-containing protein [Chloroflexota bacterium]
MTVKDSLSTDLKEAMRHGDVPRRSVIRMLLAEIHNQEIEDKKELDDEAVIRVLTKQAKQRRESIESFEMGGRDDLVQKEKLELNIILNYLPEQMDTDSIKRIVQESIDESGVTDVKSIGMVMRVVMPKVKGRADGRLVQKLASQILQDMDTS